jgi:hypothetical protein
VTQPDPSRGSTRWTRDPLEPTSLKWVRANSKNPEKFKKKLVKKYKWLYIFNIFQKKFKRTAPVHSRGLDFSFKLGS